MNIKIISLILISITALHSSFAEVIFNLCFTDNVGAGFKRSEKKWMIDEAKNSASLVGKLIKQNAIVNIQINATNQTPYAWAPTEYYHTIPEKYGKKIILSTQKKILNNDMSHDTEFNGHIEFNIDKFHEHNPEEFKQAFIHELTHTLGFLNFQEPNSSQISHYNDFDKLLHDKNGNPFLINQGDPKGNYFINPKFNCSLEMYACGECIRKQNRGKCAKIHNPKIFENGSSFTHLDSISHPRSIMTSRKCKNEYLIWNNFELSIMQELGYEIDWDNYYKIFQELYPPTVTINIDKGVLEGSDTHFEIIPNDDFPQQCSQPIIFDKDVPKILTVNMNQESKLVLVHDKSKSHLFILNPLSNSITNKLHTLNRTYKASLSKKSLKNKSEINVKFIK